eukprot:CAMPEP_0113534736 /NCGR_PEP_ID=MMETSP0015_2-20120614/5319_1 /TAXON_ID=2838 /ORGANISM="Odontella" /LENGTH=529 /DNA_ID=CAMNT_0000433919 /DNA_START=76 /DNA_END=1662 /DNA_ORIENTATION=- /assembly_acc=CAM_ASM_000160
MNTHRRVVVASALIAAAVIGQSVLASAFQLGALAGRHVRTSSPASLSRSRRRGPAPVQFAPTDPFVTAGGSVAARSPLFAASASVAARKAGGGAAGVGTGAGAELRQGGKRATLVKVGMMAFVASMCIALPLTLLPLKLLYKLNLISRIRKENLSLILGQLCSRFLLRLIPFASIRLTPHIESDPVPSVWVCNHISMLDIFFLLGTDYKLRGRNKRPIKIVYWKGLESNPVTKLLFTMSGFISVDMEDNGNGNANQYNKSMFKQLLKDVKQAFEEGFDIGILPEGQPNPTPEKGLLPIYTGAFTLARMSRRPVRMMALYGLHKLWHPSDEVGMDVTGRDVRMRVYPPSHDGGKFESADEFAATFEAVVGHFGATGEDFPKEELEWWLDGTKWEEAKKLNEEEKRAVAKAKEAAANAEATVKAAAEAATPVKSAEPNSDGAVEAVSPVLTSDAANGKEDSIDKVGGDDYALVAERAGRRRAEEAKRRFDLAFSGSPMAAPVFASRDLISTLTGDELAEAEEAGRMRGREC